jgi:hypothetical protein
MICRAYFKISTTLKYKMMIKIKQLATTHLPAILLIALLLLSPLFGISQPGSPGGGTGEAPGGESGAVPFDDNMNLVFLAVGLVFAAVIIGKQMRKNGVVHK